MKVLRTKQLKDGRSHVVIELRKDEAMPTPALQSNAFYKLGYPMDDTIIEGYILQGMSRMHWDSYSQEWREA